MAHHLHIRAGHLLHGGVGHKGAVVGAAAQLARVIQAPGPERAVGAQAQAVGRAGPYLGVGARHLGGRGVGTGRARPGGHAQLAVVVKPPAPQAAVGPQGQGVVVAGHHVGVAAGGRHGRGVGVIITVVGGGAQLAIVVLAPANQRAIGLQSQRVAVARRHGFVGARYLHGGGGAGAGARVGGRAQLPVIVVAPGIHAAVGLEGHGVVVAGRHLRVAAAHQHRRERAGAGARVSGHAQLPVIVVAPGPQRPIGLQAQAEAVARRHLHPVGGRANFHPRRACGGGAVAQLPLVVVARGPQRAIGANAERRIKARPYRAPQRLRPGPARGQQAEQQNKEPGGGRSEEVFHTVSSGIRPATRRLGPGKATQLPNDMAP